jgi:hypothetical protein
LKLRVPELTDQEAIGGAILVGIIVLFLVYVWSPYQLYLAFKYNVAPWNVIVDRYPDDECSFWHVPRGRKNCYHEEIVRTLNRQGGPVEPDSPNVDTVIVNWGSKNWGVKND